jgi:hypothetical protein
LQPDAAPPRPSPLTPDDHETLEVRRAVGDDYDVLGPICEINDGAKSSIGYLARRSGTSRLDVLRFAPGEYVDVVGPIGTALQDDADKCPKCGSPLRPGVRFCANCRANLATTRLGDAGSMSVAEWLEAKSEAVRHGFEPVGQVEDSKVRAALRGNELGATTMLLARALADEQRALADRADQRRMRGTDGAHAQLEASSFSACAAAITFWAMCVGTSS